jgi:predicted TIM-barrel fold metal-dependent hydrolase
MDWEEEDPGLPIKFRPCSNGEYAPEELSPFVREVIRRAREACEFNARRLRTSRREFLLSILGAATTLSVLDACTREAERAAHRSPGGRYVITPEATAETPAAQQTIGGEEFVLDVQGHLLEYDLNPATRFQPFFGQMFPQVDCGDPDPRACFSMQHFMEEFFLKSDTNMVVLSALPIAPAGSPLSPQIMDETRRVAEGLCHDERVLLHAQVLPNVGSLQANLDAMADRAALYPIRAWKVFTHYPDLYERNGNGWWLDDHERAAPKVGEAFIEQTVRLGIPRICAHKGFSNGSRFASPEDIGAAARRHPEVSFVVYHSGFEAGLPEGPYSSLRHYGVNRLITSLRDNGIRPNQNVYAELGSTWWYLMRSPTQAAHVLGKLLRYVGQDNVVWGTDSIFYGSPQDQIQALRAFHITAEFQDRYRYPELTPAIKHKILGRNGARLYGVDPITVPCRFTRTELEQIRRHLPSGNRTYGPSTRQEALRIMEHHRWWP